MALSPTARHRARYLVPFGAALITAGVVVIPSAASGAAHPNLPARTAAQLLASLEQAKVPEFSGTVVETARLGLPDIGNSSLVQAAAPTNESSLMQIVTLLTGSHTAQLAYGGPDKQRIAIFLSDLSEMDIVHNVNDVWTYTSNSNSVAHASLPSDGKPQQSPAQDVTTPMNPDKVAEQTLARIDPSTKVTVDRTAEVAGRPAYQLDLVPRDPNTLVGSVRIALDSKTSLPLRVQIWSRHNHSSPAFEVGFTGISMSPPSDSTFDFTTPPTATTGPLSLTHGFAGPLGQATTPDPAKARVTKVNPMNPAGAARQTGPKVLGKNWASVFVAHVDAPVAAVVPPPAINNGTPITPKSGQAAPSTQDLKRVYANAGRAPQPPNLSNELDQLGTRVAGGHLITTTLLTIFLTDDNRILIGAVTPSYIEQLAASKAAQ